MYKLSLAEMKSISGGNRFNHFSLTGDQQWFENSLFFSGSGTITDLQDIAVWKAPANMKPGVPYYFSRPIHPWPDYFAYEITKYGNGGFKYQLID